MAEYLGSTTAATNNHRTAWCASASWVAVPTSAQETRTQQCCVLPMTSAAFNTLPDNRSFHNSNVDYTSPQAPHLTRPVTTSQQQLDYPWHLPALLNSSIVSTPSAAAGSVAASYCSEWPLLPAISSACSMSSDDSPAATSTIDTIVNVLLLLGGSSTTNQALGSDSASTEDDSCEAVTGTPSAMHSAASSNAGCPPNAPVRRRPPVMLLPAEELPGLLLAA
ncbi:hypothetical protein OEZ85_011704 [Tetradesmus obliquus]|uniref:Uncharacterized protein n=1 Tax=Tetradesmus obliquus TaxID=3088 RepID=A0ABY8TRW5_TETOB|nr:hypothetical protein OEZ85_011704 [Tetradesmus obliquus]